MSYNCKIEIPENLDVSIIEAEIKAKYLDCKGDFEKFLGIPMNILLEVCLTCHRCESPDCKTITRSITDVIFSLFMDYKIFGFTVEYFFNHKVNGIRLQISKYWMRTSSEPLLIRDPIHKDMRFNLLEDNIIRSKEFQRLHGIKQLGTSYRAYPSALHTRFEHSLGTCWMAKKFMSHLRRRGFQFSTYEQDLISVAALLHDITHIPFGHTLEDEFRIFERHDEGRRIDHFLDKTSIEKVLGDQKDDVKAILTAKSGANGDYHAPFHFQIINDTICADLCDYLSRDTYFTGLSQSYDLRFLNYLIIDDKHRLAIEIAENNIIMPDVVTELTNLLRLRYVLGERVYYHHNKIVFGAMIAKSLELALEGNEKRFPEEYFYEMSDDDLISFLLSEEHGSSSARELAKRFTRRQHHARGYELSRHTDGVDVEKLVAQYHFNKANRRFTEKDIAKKLNLNDEDVIIYVPRGLMALKEADVLVKKQDDEIRKLSEMGYPEIQKLRDMYEEIWRLYVFVFTEDENKFRECENICKETFGYHSEYIRPRQA